MPEKKMKVVFKISQSNYDSYAPAMPDDWDVIQLGTSTKDKEALIETDADALIIDPIIQLTGDTISKMDNLKIIHSFGVGYNLIDLEAAKDKDIYVCNNAGVNAGAVAEQTILLMLTILRNFTMAEEMVYKGHQIDYKNICFEHGLKELGSCRVGLIGFGAIGKEVAKRLKGFGCEIWYYKPNPLPEPNEYDSTWHTMEEIMSNCDIVSLHMPVLPETNQIISDNYLSMMKPGAILVNTARGELVDQDAVCRALTSGKLHGFAADTLSPEPVRQDNTIVSLPEEIQKRMALSPHIAGITDGTFKRSYEKLMENVTAALSGKRPGNIVNGL